MTVNNPDEQPLDIDVLQAINQMLSVVNTGSRTGRRLTARARTEQLEHQNQVLRDALTQANDSIQRGAALIADLYRNVPGAKEVIDAHLAKIGITAHGAR